MTVPKKGETYQCATCKGVFKAQREHSETMTESELFFRREIKEEERCVVCDDCWQKIKKWLVEQRIV